MKKKVISDGSCLLKILSKGDNHAKGALSLAANF